MTKYWVFDYDGVIGNTIPAIIKFTQFYNNISYDQAIQNIEEYAKSPKHCNRTITTKSLERATTWNNAFSDFISKEHPPVFETFLEVLADIDDLNCAIVTNNTISTIHPLIYNNQVKFDPILGIEHGHSKEERILEIAKLWGVPLQKINFLTDTNSDVLEIAHTLPLGNIYCCTWGWNDFERASLHLPASNILREFHDITHI